MQKDQHIGILSKSAQDVEDFLKIFHTFIKPVWILHVNDIHYHIGFEEEQLRILEIIGSIVDLASQVPDINIEILRSNFLPFHALSWFQLTKGT
ncbi:MAG: hypothetical protein RBG13Loki_3149 [Promethearchaeota archaeon CR_4]|nr:MAG: hypothetical protein RBG13Loki_3149 [Candidatus Lokiarchaeota archaeon CR_4]